MALILLLTLSLCILTQAREVAYSQNLSENDSFKFNWTIDEETQMIKFEVDVISTGWVAIGLSTNGQMLNSDMYMGYIKKDGTAVVNDRYAKGRFEPIDDMILKGNNDITGITGSLVNGRTKLSWKRKFVTGDYYDQDIIKGKNLYILGAFTIQGTPETDGGSYRQHSGNYAKQIILFPEIGQSVNTASLSQKYSLFKTMDIKFDQFKISKDETQYYCKMFNVKKMLASTTVLPPTNQHAVAFEPILDKSQFIHHFILNSCDTEKVVWQDGYFPCPLSKEFCPLVVGV